MTIQKKKNKKKHIPEVSSSSSAIAVRSFAISSSVVPNFMLGNLGNASMTAFAI